MIIWAMAVTGIDKPVHSLGQTTLMISTGEELGEEISCNWLILHLAITSLPIGIGSCQHREFAILKAIGFYL